MPGKRPAAHAKIGEEVGNHQLTFHPIHLMKRKNNTPKPSRASKPRLSGTVGSIKYRLGAANPLNGRRTAVLGPGHLEALRVLLTFADPKRLGKEFVVCGEEYAQRFPADQDLYLVITLLMSWARTTSQNSIHAFHFADFKSVEQAGRRTLFVRLSNRTIPILEAMVGTVPPGSAKPMPQSTEAESNLPLFGSPP